MTMHPEAKSEARRIRDGLDDLSKSTERIVLKSDSYDLTVEDAQAAKELNELVGKARELAGKLDRP